MPSAKLAVAVGLSVLSLSACGVAAKPQAGSVPATAKITKGVDDPRKRHIQCLQQEHVSVHRIQTIVAGQPLPGFQVGTRPSGPTVTFEPTPGDAQGVQIQGQAQGAEVIGSALLYPNQASDGLLKQVEGCVAQGVTG